MAATTIYSTTRPQAPPRHRRIGVVHRCIAPAAGRSPALPWLRAASRAESRRDEPGRLPQSAPSGGGPPAGVRRQPEIWSNRPSARCSTCRVRRRLSSNARTFAFRPLQFFTMQRRHQTNQPRSLSSRVPFDVRIPLQNGGECWSADRWNRQIPPHPTLPQPFRQLLVSGAKGSGLPGIRGMRSQSSVWNADARMHANKKHARP